MNPARARATVLAVVIAIYGFIALPLPHSVREADLKRPVARAELQRWSKWLSKAGISRDEETLRQNVLRIGKPLASFRKTMLTPVKPILRWTGTGQAWGFFNTPDAFPDQLQIEGWKDSDWEVLFAALDPERSFLSSKLQYRRIRGVYDGNTDKPGPSYKNFVDWVAAETFAAHPDLVRVRVSFIRTHTTPPGRKADDMHEVRLRRVRSRPRQ